MCSGPSLRWFQGSSKISYFMKLNESIFFEMVVDIVFLISQKYHIDPRSYVNDVTLQSYCDRSLPLKDIKTNFWDEINTTWENLKERFWRLRSANILSRPSYKILICNHVLNTIKNIIQNTYIYVKPMYSIEFHIIFKTYIHMQGPSCTTLILKSQR